MFHCLLSKVDFNIRALYWFWWMPLLSLNIWIWLVKAIMT